MTYSGLITANDIIEVLPNGNLLTTTTEKHRTYISVLSAEGDQLHAPIYADFYLAIGEKADRVILVQEKIINIGGPALNIINQSGEIKKVVLIKDCLKLKKHLTADACQDEVSFNKDNFLLINSSYVAISLKASGIHTIDLRSGEIVDRKNVSTGASLKRLSDGRIATWNSRNNKIEFFTSDFSEKELSFDLNKEVLKRKDDAYFQTIYWFANGSFVTKSCAHVGLFKSIEKVIFYDGAKALHIYDGPGFENKNDCVIGRDFKKLNNDKIYFKNYSSGKIFTIDSKGIVEVK